MCTVMNNGHVTHSVTTDQFRNILSITINFNRALFVHASKIKQKHTHTHIQFVIIWFQWIA